MKKILTIIILFCALNLLASDYSIAFVHIGKNLPNYLEASLCQARLFNKECPILLIANDEALKNRPKTMDQYKITYIVIENLKRSKDHLFFQMASKLDRKWRDGFWNHTSERFFYLSEAIESFNLKNVFHMEYDNMLYVDLETLLPIFRQYYPGMAIIMHNDDHCVPGFMYISSLQPLQLLCSEMVRLAQKNKDDMSSLGTFKKRNPSHIVDSLPITIENYPRNHAVMSRNPSMFSNHLNVFNSVFDGAAFGQYLDGWDRIHGFEKSQPGAINPWCVFDASFFPVEWHLDEEGRKVPYMTYQNQKYRINNLHIHSKDLQKFKS